MRLFPRLFALPWLLAAALNPVVGRADDTASHPDVRVLIDVSGSMKQNDPHNLRRPALDLLLNLFPGNATAGVWTFGQGVDVLAPHRAVNDAWRAAARGRIGRITSNSLYTNIPEALARATDDLDRIEPGARVSVILLTDGMVDVAKAPEANAAARARLLDEILPRLRRAGVIVHTVALSPSADRELLERLAGDTQGLFAVAETAEELNRVFLQAFDAAAPAEQVPLAGNRFLVDSSIDELTALVFHADGKPLALESPDHQRHSFGAHGDDMRWFQGRGFDLITVKKPFEGEWNVVAELGPGSRVTILSNLSLNTSRLPDGLFVDGAAPALDLALNQQGEVVTDPALLKLLTLGVDVRRQQDGRTWHLDAGAAAAPPADGRYRIELPMLQEAGTYDIAVNADGKTFQRSQRQTVAVRLPFETRVDAVADKPAQRVVALFARNPAIDAEHCVVTAQIKAPDGQFSRQTLTASAPREWRLPLDTGEAGGRFELSFTVEGHDQAGAAFNWRSETIAVGSGESQVIAPAAALPEPAPAPAVQPAKAEPQPPTPQQPAAAPARRWPLYLGLALGNLLLLGLGVVAFRLIMGSGKSDVLEAGDDDEEIPTLTEPAPSPTRPGRRGAKGPALELPDDAIDIDPTASGRR